VAGAWLVLKFGGTSVSGTQQWEVIAKLAGQRLDEGNRVVLVCSAVSGITDALQALADHAGDHDPAQVEAIRQRHQQLARDLEVDADDLIDQAVDRITQLLSRIASAPDDVDPDNDDKYSLITSLMSHGEWLSTRIGERYLARGMTVEWVDARAALVALPEPEINGRRSWLSARCSSEADRKLSEEWQTKPRLLITQGFLAAHPSGGTALLGRGGSDTSAALLAGRLGARHIEIWTDVPGLFSADPRVLPQARLLRNLSYSEALEMAASGAKVVHPRCIRAAADNGIPVQVRDLGRPEFPGTTIADNGITGAHSVEGIRAVCCQPSMAVLLLKNLDTREHVGFLAWVFAQISAEGLSVDQVATSETTTTVALNRISNQLDEKTLQKIAARLKRRCAVTVYPHCSGINLVGRGARVALKHIDPGSGFFATHPLLMLSQSANDLCISLLLQAGDASELLGVLHGALVENNPPAADDDGVFGPTWREIRD